MVTHDLNTVQQLLTKGVADVIVKKDLEKKLLSGKKLVCKLGIDPTGADLHIGHMVVVRKLREFQKAGHQIIIIVGDYTARIGDPTGRDAMREPLTLKQIETNMKTWEKQLFKILDKKKTKIAYQTKWFNKFSLQDVLQLAGLFSVQQLIERDMFQRRLEKEQSIGLHEFMYPLLQGYDSVAIKADIEFGGTDQTFNLLAGRVVQEHFKLEPQNIITMPLLEGLDGRKMSKSYGNHVPVLAEPGDMYGRIMSMKDDLILHYFELATDMPHAEVKEIEAVLAQGENPRNVKARLAREIVSMYHDAAAADAAAAEFDNIFKDKKAPTDIPSFELLENPAHWTDVLYDAKLVTSKGDARRMLEQGAVKLNHKKVETWDKPVTFRDGDVVQVGKRKFIKIVMGDR